MFLFTTILLSLFLNSMARTKTMPKKEREGRIILRSSEERARLAREVRQEGERSERVRSRRLARWARKEKTEMRPPLLCTTPPQPKGPHPRGGGADAGDGEAG